MPDVHGHRQAIDAAWAEIGQEQGAAGLKTGRKGENKMRKYKSGGQLESVICNCCGKKMVVKDGVLREGVISVHHAWDFFSEKDGEVHHWDMCEECYDNLLGQFRVEPDVEERVEFV